MKLSFGNRYRLILSIILIKSASAISIQQSKALSRRQQNPGSIESDDAEAKIIPLYCNNENINLDPTIHYVFKHDDLNATSESCEWSFVKGEGNYKVGKYWCFTYERVDYRSTKSELTVKDVDSFTNSATDTRYNNTWFNDPPTITTKNGVGFRIRIYGGEKSLWDCPFLTKNNIVDNNSTATSETSTDSDRTELIKSIKSFRAVSDRRIINNQDKPELMESTNHATFTTIKCSTPSTIKLQPKHHYILKHDDLEATKEDCRWNLITSSSTYSWSFRFQKVDYRSISSTLNVAVNKIVTSYSANNPDYSKPIILSSKEAILTTNGGVGFLCEIHLNPSNTTTTSTPTNSTTSTPTTSTTSTPTTSTTSTTTTSTTSTPTTSTTSTPTNSTTSTPTTSTTSTPTTSATSTPTTISILVLSFLGGSLLVMIPWLIVVSVIISLLWRRIQRNSKPSQQPPSRELIERISPLECVLTSEENSYMEPNGFRSPNRSEEVTGQKNVTAAEEGNPREVSSEREYANLPSKPFHISNQAYQNAESDENMYQEINDADVSHANNVTSSPSANPCSFSKTPIKQLPTNQLNPLSPQ